MAPIRTTFAAAAAAVLLPLAAPAVASQGTAADGHRHWAPVAKGVPVGMPRLDVPGRTTAEVRAEAREMMQRGQMGLAQMNPPRWGVVNRNQLRADLWGPQSPAQPAQAISGFDRKKLYVGA
jgi:hypothetical protein